MRIIGIGDIHGDLQKLKTILKHANIIDNNENLTGNKCTLVQLGDMIDRTPSNIRINAAFHFLRDIQEEAEQNGSKIIRLLGNHELMVLQGDFSFYSMDLINHNGDGESATEMGSIILNDILEGKIQGSYTQYGWLFVHGGLRTDVRKELLNDKYISVSNVNMLVDNINDILVQSAKSNDFTHTIFQVGSARGGWKSVGGVFWTDFREELLSSAEAFKVKQIVGHTPIYDGNIQFKNNLIDIDSGMSECYGGKISYILLDNKKMVLFETSDSKLWEQHVI